MTIRVSIQFIRLICAIRVRNYHIKFFRIISENFPF